ncbi:MAG: hypothetical protein CSA29_01660 [Desulfobacterales bacterium]|nr:MAG: hypothetical protein CSA29_01660 [Desulfobacterales bacterium]
MVVHVLDTWKLDTLSKIYDLFDGVVETFAVACKAGCDTCCTCNVTATGLETAYVFSQLEKTHIDAVTAKIENEVGSNRYRPALTTNGFARAAMSGDVVAEEENDPAWGRCPLLVDGRCSIYPVRPFGCRSMMSNRSCQEVGWAQMTPLALTISTVILQYIEHLDDGGFFGNFLDMVGWFGTHGESGQLSFDTLKASKMKAWALPNNKIPALMVPPEHRSDVAPLIRALNDLIRTDTR